MRADRATSSDGLARALDLCRRHLDEGPERTEFELLGRRWTLLRGVFSPAFTPVTELFTSWLPFPAGGSFLDLGSGAGVTAVRAALAGCRVTALDISSEAVANTRLNAERNGVTGDHLTATGRLLLGFSDLGEWEELREECRAVGLAAAIVCAERRRLEVPVEFQLVELRSESDAR